MLDLSNATFIIPVRLDSFDRAFNFEYIINYLCRNLKTNIIIFEQDTFQKAGQILNRINPIETKIDYRFEQSEDTIFHRTRILNEMLFDVKTKVVVNYDCDVLLKPDTYLKAYNEILNGVDLCYPFFFGESQKQILRPGIHSDLTDMPAVEHLPAQAQYGHCCFLNTESYKQMGGENESFISWGPEDIERCYKAQTLGYNVKWLDDCYVFHIEHVRGINSGRDNPHFENCEKLFEHIKSLPAEDLREYYNTAPYLKKYKKKMITLLTYADGSYMDRQDKLINKAIELDCVDYVISMNRTDLIETDFYKQNKKLLDEKRGSGYWVWKPYLILEALKTMEEDDILIYIDSGDMIRKNFRTFVQRKMRTTHIFLTTGGYINEQYTKQDCFEIMGCIDEKYDLSTQMEAGIILCKNTPETVKIFKEWLKWCLTPGVVTDGPFKSKNSPEFIDHRHDQSVLSLLQVKYNLPHSNEIRTFINCNQND